MSITYMFNEFVSLLSYIFNFFLHEHFFVLIIGVGAALCGTLITFVLRWFTDA